VDFIELVERLNLLVHGSKAKKLEALFSVYDLDGSGKISKEEFEEVVRALSHKDHQQTEQVRKRLFSAVDANHDGQISLDEFLQLADGAHVTLNSAWEGDVQKSFGLLH
jgi:Ca2+-binding EF-hand superfamily protein